MISMITYISHHEDEPSDETYIEEMMQDLSDTHTPSQRININRRI